MMGPWQTRTLAWWISACPETNVAPHPPIKHRREINQAEHSGASEWPPCVGGGQMSERIVVHPTAATRR
jgi:hypothetical protein